MAGIRKKRFLRGCLLCPSRHQHLPDIVLSFLHTPLQIGFFLLQYEKETRVRIRVKVPSWHAAFMAKGYGFSVTSDFQEPAVCWEPGVHSCPRASPHPDAGAPGRVSLGSGSRSALWEATALFPRRKQTLKTGVVVHEVTPDRQRPGNSRTKLWPHNTVSQGFPQPRPGAWSCHCSRADSMPSSLSSMTGDRLPRGLRSCITRLTEADESGWNLLF